MSDKALTIKFEGGPFDGKSHDFEAGSADEIFGRRASEVHVEDEGRTVYVLKDAADDAQTYTLKT